jgi:hypothetical protein
MINDAPTPADEFVTTRFYTDVDRDLAAMAIRYGTSHHNLVVFDGDHNPRWRTQSPTFAAIEQAILAGDPFTLAVPAEERRYSWGSYENQTTREVTLGDAVNEINARTVAFFQPQVTAELLWSYATNAAMRSAALHGRSEGEQHSFDTDPGRARLPAGTRVRFPVVQPANARPVYAAAAATVPVSPPPAWLPSYHHHIAEIERLAHRVDLVRRHIERLNLEGTQQVALLDFTLEILDRLMLETSGTSTSLRAVRDAVSALRRSAQTHMVEHDAQSHRPQWFLELDRATAELERYLTNERYLRWQDVVWSEGSRFDREGLVGAANLVIAQALEAMGQSGTATARAFYARSLRLVDGEDVGASQDSVLVLYLRKFFSAVVSAGPIAISNTPGPPSIAGVALAYQMFESLSGDAAPAAVVGRRRATFGQLFKNRMTAADVAAFDAALAAPAPQRAGLMHTVLRRSLGSGANAFALACSLYALYSTIDDGLRNPLTWNGLGRGLQLTSGVATTAFATLSFEASQNVARGLIARFSPAAGAEAGFGTRLGTLAGRVTGILGVLQGLYQIADFATTESADQRYSNLIAGTITLAAGLLTLAIAAEATPGLQVVGILLALGALVAAAWPHDADNVKAVIQGLLQSFEQHAIAPTPTDLQYYDSFLGGGFGDWSYYRLVVGEETAQRPSSHALAVALRAVRTAIESWPGHALHDNADNRAYLQRHHFSADQIEDLID